MEKTGESLDAGLYELTGIKQVYDQRTVLDIRHLELRPGRSYALLGPNGCGKTTLLNVLAFLRPPAFGTVSFKGRRVQWGKDQLTALRRQVVLVNQHPVMFTDSVIKNVEYGLRMRSVNASKRRKIAGECLDRVGMGEFAARPAHKLSGGETQRVAIARALACSPEVMLFDEPTAGVDVENQAVIENIIRDIRKDEGVSVIFSTHRRFEASRLAQDRIFLFEGKLTGPGGENLLSGTIVDKKGRRVCIIGESIELEVPSGSPGPASVFIKPEGIRILGPDRPPKRSTDGSFSAKVSQLTDEGDFVKVLLDIGVPLKTLLPAEEFKRSPVIVGENVLVALDSGAALVAQGPGDGFNSCCSGRLKTLSNLWYR
jgi:tungstate transport system ATP-binding protein